MAFSPPRPLQNIVHVRRGCGKKRGFRVCPGQSPAALYFSSLQVEVLWDLSSVQVAPGLPSCLGLPREGREAPLTPPPFAHKSTFIKAPPGPPDRTGPARCQLSMPFPQEPREPGVLVGGAKPQLGGRGPRPPHPPPGCCHNAQRRLRCPQLAADLLTLGSFPLRPSSPSEADKALS